MNKQSGRKKHREALQTKAPDDLVVLMERVNGLPSAPKTTDELWQVAEGLSGTPLKDFGRELYVFFKPDPDRPIDTEEAFIMVFGDYVEQLRGAAREYVGPCHPQTAKTILFVEPYDMPGFKADETMAMTMVRYDRLVKARLALEEIATWGGRLGFLKSAYEQTGDWLVSSMFAGKKYGNLDVRLTIDEQGKVAIETGELLKPVLGVDAGRIRQCLVCMNIFWATRKDQKCCGKACANNYRVRRSREKQKENATLYKLSRIRKASAKVRPKSKAKLSPD